MMEETGVLLLKETNMADRAPLAKAASELLPDVSDQKMKVFLGAVSADIPDDKGMDQLCRANAYRCPAG